VEAAAGIATTVRLGPESADIAVRTLTASFQEDPSARWAFRRGEGIERPLRHLFRFLVDYGLRHGELHCAGSPDEAVSIWLPSDRAEMTARRALGCGVLTLPLRIGPSALRRLGRLRRFMTEHRHHHADFPHHYLSLVGVRPDQRYRGLAGRLLRGVLVRLERESLPAYMETAVEKNVWLYEHFGFQVCGKAVFAPADLPFWFMLRKSGIGVPG
jgi:ribosomal protein S18 acetylase RimI-like enzyme